MISKGDILAVTPAFTLWMGLAALLVSGVALGDEFKVKNVTHKGVSVLHVSGAIEFQDVPLDIVMEMRQFRLSLVSIQRLN